MIVIAASLALAACGDDLSHPSSMPPLVDHGGPILHVVRTAVVTYPGEAITLRADQFNRFVLGSDWLREVGAPYGIRGGDYLGSYQVDHAAPATLSWDDLMADLDATVPLPADATIDGDPPLYMIYLPRGTTFTGYGTQCDDWGAFHSYDSSGRVFAVMPPCAPYEDVLTGYGSSHELIEAATDPHGDAWYVDDLKYASPWAFEHEEVGDLCEYIPKGVNEDGWTMTRSWSLDAADQPRPDPCVPVPAGDVWTDVDVDPDFIEIENGGSADVTLTGWSSGPTADWPILIDFREQDVVTPVVTLSSPTINDGRKVTMHVQLPDDAEHSFWIVEIWSGHAKALLQVNATVLMGAPG